MAIVFVGIDLAKNVFAVHAVDERGKPALVRASAICEAVQRPQMRFVPVKSIEQQSPLMVHHARQGWIEARTACINCMRGLLAELGHVSSLKAATVRAPTCGTTAGSAGTGQHRDRRSAERVAPARRTHRAAEVRVAAAAAR